MRSLTWRSWLVVAVVVAGVVFALPTIPVYKYIPEWLKLILPRENINLGLDLRGGMHIVLEADTSKLSGTDEEAIQADVDGALEVIRNRIDSLGVAEPTIQKQGNRWIVVQLPGLEEKDTDRALNIIRTTALLEFKLVSDNTTQLQEALAGKVPEGYELAYQYNKDTSGKLVQGGPLLLEKKPVITGAALKDASVSYQQSQFGEPVVSFEFKPQFAGTFERATGENIGRRMAIVLDGKVQSAPSIRSRISGGSGIIEGPPFSYEEARDLAIVLRAGALPVPLKIIENRVVGPSLGRDSIDRGVKASLVGVIVVVAFMLVYYRASGGIADFALLLNFVILLAVLSLFRATLTLPGIAGVALTLGMAVDANVLIFERIREELRAGKTVRAAIDSGYRRAFWTIFDSNLTTLIAAVFLFQFGTGPVRGFAVTLTLGILISMFTAIVVTRVIFDLTTRRRDLATLSI